VETVTVEGRTLKVIEERVHGVEGSSDYQKDCLYQSEDGSKLLIRTVPRESTGYAEGTVLRIQRHSIALLTDEQAESWKRGALDDSRLEWSELQKTALIP